MGSINKKIRKNSINIVMAIKYKCDICGFERIIPQAEFKKMNDEIFKNSRLFVCDNCNIRMKPKTVEVDY